MSQETFYIPELQGTLSIESPKGKQIAVLHFPSSTPMQQMSLDSLPGYLLEGKINELMLIEGNGEPEAMLKVEEQLDKAFSGPLYLSKESVFHMDMIDPSYHFLLTTDKMKKTAISHIKP